MAAAEIAAFRDGLGELGYVEGQNIAIDVRTSDSPEQYAVPAAELVALPVDLILTPAGGTNAEAAMAATSTIPIVFAAAPDPVRTGLVASLARPGGNVTGLSSLTPQLLGKSLQLLLDLAPGVSPILFLTRTAGDEATGATQEAKQAAQLLGVQLLVPTTATVGDLPAAFQLAIDEHAEALWVTASPQMNTQVGLIMAFATAHRLPVLSQTRIFADAGGLIFYGPNRLAQFRRAATYVDKILKGAKPGDLPVEQPTTFEFVINLKTARALGLIIPDSVLQQATEVIQ
jgi:putative ABC transport system substrate-binding protein